MWIVLGIVAYIAIACVTFIACADGGFFSAISAALVWPALVIVAAVAAVVTVIASVITYGFFTVKNINRK